MSENEYSAEPSMSQLELAAALRDARAKLLVPGVMECAKCKFYLVRTNLHMDGRISAGDSSPERCPNDCGPMWPVTWQKQAEELAARCFKYQESLALIRQHYNFPGGIESAAFKLATEALGG
jgi:hypothetical protein